MSTPITEKDVQEFLDGLGADADTVAASLRTLGVKGVRSSTCRCPVARALTQHFGTSEVSVTSNVYLAVSDGLPVRALYADTPKAVRAFMGRFDLGPHYADLVDEQ